MLKGYVPRELSGKAWSPKNAQLLVFKHKGSGFELDARMHALGDHVHLAFEGLTPFCDEANGNGNHGGGSVV